MTTRRTYKLVIAEIKAAQTSLTNADVRYRRRGDSEHDETTAKARRALAEAMRCVRALRQAARAREVE